jgi:hypothetical protein
MNASSRLMFFSYTKYLKRLLATLHCGRPLQIMAVYLIGSPQTIHSLAAPFRDITARIACSADRPNAIINSISSAFLSSHNISRHCLQRFWIPLVRPHDKQSPVVAALLLIGFSLTLQLRHQPVSSINTSAKFPQFGHTSCCLLTAGILYSCGSGALRLTPQTQCLIRHFRVCGNSLGLHQPSFFLS